MAEVGEWLGGKPPGGVRSYTRKGRHVGWRFEIAGDTAKKLPRNTPHTKHFLLSKFGERTKAEAEDYQRQLAEDHELELKNQYRFRTDPNDGLPYIEFHIRDREGKDHYPKCDVGDLSLLEEHTWSVFKQKNNIYVQTHVTINDKKTMKLFHRFKCPDWPSVDHYSKIPEENRNGLDNRSKHLRDGSGGVNEENCRPRYTNKSGVSGLSYDTRKKAWRVSIQTKGVRSPPRRFRGPEDKTHPSYHEACAYARELAAQVGNMNGR